MQKVKNFKCPECKKVYNSLATWSNHILKQHPDIIPKGFTPARFFYYLQTGKTGNQCIICKSPTQWNEATGKYERFCPNPKCREEYRKIFKDRMIGKYGKVSLLDDPEQQRKMLEGKKNHGYYKFQDGGKVGYNSTYEKDFLRMLDVFLRLPSASIMGPSPHTYYYKYKNAEDKEHEGEKFYIPDYFIPSLNLEIEIKQNTSTHPKILAIDKIKEAEKDEMMHTQDGLHYIKIVDKDYSGFYDLLLQLKETLPVKKYIEEEYPKDIVTEANQNLDIRILGKDDPRIAAAKKKILSKNKDPEVAKDKKLQTFIDQTIKMSATVYNPDGYQLNVENEAVFNKKYKVLTPEQVKRFGGGTSWDMAGYIADFCKHANLMCQCVGISIGSPGKNTSHATVLVYRGNQVLLLEASLKKYAGIKVFPTDASAVQWIVGAYIQAYSLPEDAKFSVTYYEPEKLYGMTPPQIYKYMTKYCLGTFKYAPGVQYRDFAFEDFAEESVFATNSKLIPGKKYSFDDRRILTVMSNSPMHEYANRIPLKDLNANQELLKIVRPNRYDVLLIPEAELHSAAIAKRNSIPFQNKEAAPIRELLDYIILKTSDHTPGGSMRNIYDEALDAIAEWIQLHTEHPYAVIITIADASLRGYFQDYPLFYMEYGSFRNYREARSIAKYSYRDALQISSANHAMVQDGFEGRGEFIDEPENLDLYHISPVKNLKELTPGISPNVNLNENVTIPRVSAAPSIVGAIDAAPVYTGYIYAYKLELLKSTRVFKPNVKMVPDAERTEEYWILDPVKVNLIETYWICVTPDGRITFPTESRVLINHKEYLLKIGPLKNKKSDVTELKLSDLKSKKIITQILYNHHRGYIQSINTLPEYQNRGFASAILYYMQKMQPDIQFRAVEPYKDFITDWMKRAKHGMKHVPKMIARESIDTQEELEAAFEAAIQPILNYLNTHYNDPLEFITEAANYSPENKYPVFILVTKGHTLLSWAIEKVTKDYWTHSCIGFNVELDPIYSFGMKSVNPTVLGFVKTNPKSAIWSREPYQVYVTFMNRESVEKIKNRLEYFIQNADKLKYHFAGLIEMWMSIRTENQRKWVCSRFVAELLNAGNKELLRKDPSLYRPQELTNLPNLELVGQGNDIGQYNPTEVQHNLAILKKKI